MGPRTLRPWPSPWLLALPRRRLPPWPSLSPRPGSVETQFRTLPSARGSEPPRPSTWPPAFTLAFASTALAFAVAATWRQALSAGRRNTESSPGLGLWLGGDLLSRRRCLYRDLVGTDQTRGSTRAKQNPMAVSALPRVKTSSRLKKITTITNPPATFMAFAFTFALAFAAAFTANNVANSVKAQKPISHLWLGYHADGVSSKVTFGHCKPHYRGRP